MNALPSGGAASNLSVRLVHNAAIQAAIEKAARRLGGFSKQMFRVLIFVDDPMSGMLVDAESLYWCVRTSVVCCFKIQTGTHILPFYRNEFGGGACLLVLDFRRFDTSWGNERALGLSPLSGLLSSDFRVVKRVAEEIAGSR